MPANSLSAADREFLGALGDVIFGNPFSAQRAALIVRLAPGALFGDLTRDREALARIVAPRIAPLLEHDAAGFRRLSAEDRRVAEPAIFYVSYHHYVPELAAPLERQAKAGASLP